MKTIYGTMKDLKEFIKEHEYPKYSVLLRSEKTDLPLGAYVYDGGAGGYIFSRREIRKRYHLPPSHRYACSCAAYDILVGSLRK